MFRPHLEIFTKERRNLFLSLGKFPHPGFLSGGTALALQLGHRRSYDFDIFVYKPISRQLAFRVKNFFAPRQLLVNNSDEFSFISKESVKVSFIYYPFKSLYKPLMIANLKLAFWKDIALDKAHTVGRRAEWRDYVDLFFVIKSGFSLKEILRGAKKKFGGSFSEKLFLSQLCYLDDIHDFSIDIMGKNVTAVQLKRFFEREVGKIKI